MDNNQLFDLIVKTLGTVDPPRTPSDFESEMAALRFSWRGMRFRVTCALFVERLDRSVLIVDSMALLVGGLLKQAAPKELEPRWKSIVDIEPESEILQRTLGL
jgi:hypothetical protein